MSKNNVISRAVVFAALSVSVVAIFSAIYTGMTPFYGMSNLEFFIKSLPTACALVYGGAAAITVAILPALVAGARKHTSAASVSVLNVGAIVVAVTGLFTPALVSWAVLALAQCVYFAAMAWAFTTFVHREEA